MSLHAKAAVVGITRTRLGDVPGFNSTHMAPLSIGEFYQQAFDATESEIVYTPHVAEKLVEPYPTGRTR